ncbi:MAG: glycosyltransferase [Leptospiraceae bacterium]|nr:glycosyltransferase [Leptospiraceae bacterium]
MKIMYFTDTFLPKIDGVSLSIKNFSEHLSLKDYEFLICCPEYGEGDFIRMNEKIRVERFMSGFLPSYPDIKVVLPSPMKISNLIEEFKPDVCHIHTPGLMGLYAVNACEKFGIPVVGTYHTLMAEQNTYVSLYRIFKLDKLFLRINKFNKALSIKNLLKFQKWDNFNIKKKIIHKICNHLYDRCDIVISPSNLLKEQLLEYGIEKPIQVISNGMDLTRFKGEVKQAPDNPKILHVGRISYEKNCDVVINSFELILKEFPDATLTIIGDGPALPSLKLQAEQKGMKEKVIFTGFVDNSKLHEVYPKYDLFMTASTMETQGLVILEAIACGLPAIGVKSFAIPELVQEGKNGFNAEPFQPEEMSKLAIKVLKDKELYSSFSKNSLEIALTHEMSKCVDKMHTLYTTMKEYNTKEKKTTIMNLLFS